MRCVLKRDACIAVLVLGILPGFCLTPEALAQSLNIPLQLEQAADGVILTVNVGINGGPARPYLFDTGSGLFNALYTSPAAFGGLSGNMASQGLPTGIFYNYGDNPSGSPNEYDSNAIYVPSLTFYVTPTSTSGVTLNATTPSGASSNFIVNAVYAHDGKYIDANTPALQSISTPGYSFGGYWGVFGADAFVDLFQGGHASLPTPGGDTNHSTVAIGGILGQAVVPGTTAGYIVAANGQALSALSTGEGPVPGSTVNGPQPTQCAIASCNPAVILGLTPALLAQFAPINTLAALPSTPAFPNSGAPALQHYPIDLTVTLNIPGTGTRTITQQTLLDTGTSNNQIYRLVGGTTDIAQGSTLTISNGGSPITTYSVGPTGSNGYSYPAPPYDVIIAPATNAQTEVTFLGIGFFLQNSVLFDLAGDAIGWTPNYVTAADIVTTPQAPLVIGSGSVPLGLAGVISGDGGVAITPGGSATLSGTNTYTGATTITGGYLALVGPGSISASSSVNVSAGGIFDISGVTLPGGAVIQSLSGDSNGTVYLGANTLTLSNASGSYAGILYGSGGLTLNGGVETLSGIDAYGGPTTVNGGFLVINGVLAGTSNVTVNAGGALGGDGIIDPPAVTIASGGTLAPGKPGVPGSGMMIIGDLAMQPGSTFMSLVGAGGASFANVSGTATLAGTATAAFAGGPLSKNLTILSSSGLNGAFDNFTTVNLPQSLSAGISYDSNNVYLNFTSHMAAILGLTENQRAIASNLDSYFNSGRTLPTSFSSLYGLSGSTLANGISTLSGETTTGAVQTAFQLMDNFLGAMLDPFVDGRSNTNPSNGGSALGYASASHSTPSQFADAYAALKAPKPEAPAPQPWAVWGAAYGGSLNLNASDAASGAHDVSGSTYGFATGADYRATPNTTLGFAVAGGGTNWSLSDGLGGGNSTAAQVGVYARTQSGPAYLAGALAFTNYWFNTNREAFNSDPLSGQFGAQSFGARAETGYRFNMLASTLPAMTWTPYAAVQPQTFHSQAFSETDVLAGGLALNYQANDTVDTRTEIGARLATSVPLLNGMAVDFQGRAAWAHDFVSTPTLGVAFQSLPGSSFAVYGARLADNSALVSAGGELHITRSLSLIAKFDGEFARQEQIASGRAILRYSW